RAAHYSRLFNFVNTFFRSASAGGRCQVKQETRRLSGEASRLLWRVFRFRQHLLSKPVAVAVRRIHRGEGRAAARERIVKRSGNSSRFFSCPWVNGQSWAA